MSCPTNLKKLLAGGAFFFLLFQVAYTQKMTVRHYGVADGLTNEWISDFAQDSAGFLWMTTQYGLNRFDGRDFRSYTYRPDETSGPAANFAKCLLVNGRKKLWFGTLGRGLNRMNTRTETFDTPSKQLDWPEFGIVDALFQTQSGSRYLATAKGIYFQEKAGQRPGRVLPDRVVCFKSLPDGSVISGGEKGIHLISGDQPRLLNSLPVRALQPIGTDSLLVLSGNELRLLLRSNNVWSPTPWRLAISTAQSPFFTPRFERGPAKFWLAAGPRVWSFSRSLNDIQEHYPKKILGQDFSGVQVHVIFFDQEGDMWWGTNRGAFLLRPALAFLEPMQTAAPELPQAVREIILVNKDRWLATAKGIFKVPEKGKVQRISPHSVNALHYDRKAYVYAVEEGLLVRFLAASGRKDPTFRLLDQQDGARQCWRITEDRRGRIWIGRWNHLACFDPVTNELSKFPLPGPGRSGAVGIIDLAVDRDDRLWVCTLHRGALRVENISSIKGGQALEYREFRHNAEEANSLSSDLAQQVHQTADGTIWIATDGGLNRFRPTTEDFQRFLRGPELPDDKFVSMSSGPASDLWLGSISHGILHFDPVSEQFTTYDTDDGLKGNAMLISSVFRQEDGGMWFGGQNGLQFFRPKVIRARARVQSPSLSWLSYHRYRMDTTLAEHLPLTGRTEHSPLKIEPADNVISWAFAALSFRSPETTDYYFKLEGYHNDWLPPSKTGKLTLSNIPPGNYVLRAKAENAAAGWATEHPPLYFRVLPPWYQSVYAYAIYALLLLGFLYSLYRTLLLRRLSAERLGWFERIAHEFRTPLAIIAGAADRSQRGPKPERAGQLELIERQTHLLGGQVDRILELARLRASPTPPKKTIADFTAFHHYLLQSYAPLAEEGNIELRFSAPEKPLRFSFAEEDWRAITGNLLSNALKYTPSGGHVTLALSTEDGRGDTKRVVLTITDTGKGMSQAFLRHLFRPFSREEEGTTNGTGLGLALVKETADRIGVKLKVMSQPGQGSTFIVRLSEVMLQELTLPSTDLAPAAAAKELTPHALSEVAPRNAPVLTDERALILVAEDHPELTAYLRYCLSDGYRLLTTADGLTAWDLAQERIPDLVVTDVSMPGLTGLELTKRIAKTPATNHVPVVVLTARSGDEARLEGLKAGAEAYLTKPFRRQELLTLVEGILERRARLRARYQATGPEDKTNGASPNPFVQAATQIVEARLANEDFSVADLAAAVFLERTQLFRKLKALTGLTPTLFIRRIRLQRARTALREPGITVAQVAYAHGFRDPAYFARVFREEFGLSPSGSRK